MTVLLLLAALALAAIAVALIVFEDTRLAGRSARRWPREPAEPGPVRRAAAERSREVVDWLTRRLARAQARPRDALAAVARAAAARRTRPPPEWLVRSIERWDRIDARAQAFVERHTSLRRPAPPVRRAVAPWDAATDEPDRAVSPVSERRVA